MDKVAGTCRLAPRPPRPQPTPHLFRDKPNNRTGQGLKGKTFASGEDKLLASANV